MDFHGVPGSHEYKDRAFPLDSRIGLIRFTFVTKCVAYPVPDTNSLEPGLCTCLLYISRFFLFLFLFSLYLKSIHIIGSPRIPINWPGISTEPGIAAFTVNDTIKNYLDRVPELLRPFTFVPPQISRLHQNQLHT
jgi:hypothetical protein